MSKTVVPPDRPGAEPEVRIFRPTNRHYNSIRVDNGPTEQHECWGYQSCISHTILYHFLGICTFGVVYVLLSWFPVWLATVKFRRCSVADADTILLQDHHKHFHLCKIQRQVATEKSHNLCPELKDYSFLQSSVEDKRVFEKLKYPNGVNGLHVKENTCIFRCFDFRYSRYVWVQAEETFKLLTGMVPGVSCSELSAKHLGVSDEHRQQKLRLFGRNVIEIATPSVPKLLFEEVLNPFYCFQTFCIVLWSLDNYYIYATCVLLISLFGISLSLYETRKQRLRLRDMVRKSSTNSKVLLMKDNGDFAECLPETLVPGDIICIPVHGCLMPCDAVLIEGNAIVNEAVLTGESAPVTKISLNVGDTEKFSVEEHKRHILFHGTTVIQTRYYEGAHVRAVVLETGFYTVKGDLFKSILYPKPIDFKFHRDALRLIGCMAFISCCGMCYSIYIYNDHGEDIWKIILRALDLVTIVVPPALPAALTVGIVYSQRRLKQQKIFCIQPSRINACGKIKLVCFDKTGTLTEEGLDLMGVIPAENGHLAKIVEDVKQLPPSHPLVVGMATCHSLTLVNGKLTGDPLDLKLFESTDWEINEPHQTGQEGNAVFNSLIPTTVNPRRTAEEGANETSEEITDPMLGQIGIVKQFPFSSGLQRMSVITRELSQDCFSVFTKGSPERVFSLSRPDTIPNNFHRTLHLYAHQGYRVIALAKRTLEPKVSFLQMSRFKRDEVERDLTFVGLMVMRNSLKPSTHGVIADLNRADIRTVMVTGDNLLTAISVGRDCGMVKKEENIVIVDVMSPDDRMHSAAHILWRASNSSLSTSQLSLAGDSLAENSLSEGAPSRAASANEFLIEMSRPRFHFALTGRSFSSLVEFFPELISKILVRGTIFARFSPEQKTELVERYIDLQYIVGMVGDGANDCGVSFEWSRTY
ncbi:hypothetical protein RvY_08950-2 [Ramazzottius varieornatus]|uniref:Cation-transporting ATPase n=1 Tax=Ramazzottius varieornatus TaxID=947166 RepID=A0A1D1V7M2_RAMVA|nr:hypothetical protein RvY_08950-2 [Ramazzottius varieornatus]